MAQQTINVGTAPNDGTGTPLRTAFQYTNSNFSELYTALGGGSGLPGTSGQVLFNNGTNIAGDAGLVYNSTTDALTIGGNVQAASATITGDLTVDTSTLKVDSTNNRVGIRTASPAEPLTVDNSSGVTTGAIRIYATDQSHSRLSIQNGNGQAYHLVAGNPGASNAGFALYDNTGAATRWYVDNTGVHTWQNVGGVAGTAMTLNATGLGVGASPQVKLTVRTPHAVATATTYTGGLLIHDEANGIAPHLGAGIAYNGGDQISWIQSNSSTGVYPLALNPAGGEVRIGGNVGIGVTPSAWSSGLRAINFSTNGVLYANGGNSVFFGNNYYNDGAGTNRYLTNNVAAAYGQVTGAHQWFTAASGTAGNAITFTQAMTLDASGNLLVGKTATNLQVVGCELKADGTVFSTLVDTTNAAASSYQLYSTGAATYRFYVGMGGTVFATNTTISGISDARLKENVQDIDVGLGAILALKPRKFDWKEGKGKNIKGDRGFIAQEFETVFPNLIDEWKDEAPEGEAPYKSVRQDLIPVLVKAIQELAAEVNALKNA